MDAMQAGRRALRSAAGAVVLTTAANVVLVSAGCAPALPTPLQTMALQALALMVFVALGAVIHQDPAYHRFADARPLPLSCCALYVPNAADVLSNVLFLLFGLDGLVALRASQMRSAVERQAWALLFLAAVFVAFGSAYYHWRPNSKRLLWDRLPMSVGFASVLFIVVIERLPLSIPSYLLYLIMLVSITSTLFWVWTDDLRPYLVVQYYGFLFVLQALMLFDSSYTSPEQWWWIIACYGVAKIFEALDQHIFKITNQTISGHTLKHLVASLLFRLAAIHIHSREIRIPSGDIGGRRTVH